MSWHPQQAANSSVCVLIFYFQTLDSLLKCSYVQLTCCNSISFNVDEWKDFISLSKQSPNCRSIRLSSTSFPFHFKILQTRVWVTCTHECTKEEFLVSLQKYRISNRQPFKTNIELPHCDVARCPFAIDLVAGILLRRRRMPKRTKMKCKIKAEQKLWANFHILQTVFFVFVPVCCWIKRQRIAKFTTKLIAFSMRFCLVAWNGF